MRTIIERIIVVAAFSLWVTVASAQQAAAPTSLPGSEAEATGKKTDTNKKVQAAKKTDQPKKVNDLEMKNITISAKELAAVQEQAKVQADALAAARERANRSNPFNRTMRPRDAYNLPPVEDGIHDPGNETVKLLNKPLDAYTDLPRNKAGTRVDWVAALAAKKIAPRWDRTNPNAEGMVMDMDIVRVPKGSMPNVVFPHRQHTEWLACSNCHPAIFVPQKGANEISMPLILSGQKCGVCHGKVAFPPAECVKCHSQKKDAQLNVTASP